MTQDQNAPETGAETDSKPAQDDAAQFRETAAKYGAAYAVFGDAFQSPGLTTFTRLVSWGLAASAVGVVALAILSKF